MQDRKSTLPDSLTLGRESSALYHVRFPTSISCERPLLGSTLGTPVDLRLNRSRGPHRPVYRSRFCLVNRTEPWDTSVNWRLSTRITCPDIGTKVLVRSQGGLEDGGGLLCPGSFTHSAKLLSCPWEHDPWGTCRCFSEQSVLSRSTECPKGSPLGQGCVFFFYK